MESYNSGFDANKIKDPLFLYEGPLHACAYMHAPECGTSMNKILIKLSLNKTFYLLCNKRHLLTQRKIKIWSGISAPDPSAGRATCLLNIITPGGRVTGWGLAIGCTLPCYCQTSETIPKLKDRSG